MRRREVIGLGAAALAGLASGAHAAEPAWSSTWPDPTEIIPLWPIEPPGGATVVPALRVTENAGPTAGYKDRFVEGVATPTLTVVRPAQPDGSALLIAPGGGYSHLAIDAEGFDVARTFADAGITAFVLTYRLPGEGWRAGPDVPLQDAQRAMRLVRANVASYKIDPARIGVLGFSAGGHVAASLATRFGAIVYKPVDATDGFDARPTIAAMIYPVITMLKPFAHEASREKLLGVNPAEAIRAAYSCERLVKPDVPPSFLAAAEDDPDVPPENSLNMLASLRANHVPSELHFFERGGHGFGIREAQGLPVEAWPDLLLRWGRSHKVFSGG